MARCATCNATIIWATNDTTGRPAPIDARPTPDGPVILLPGDRYHVLTKAERAELALAGRQSALFATEIPVPVRYTNHWQTCPNPPRRR